MYKIDKFQGDLTDVSAILKTLRDRYFMLPVCTYFVFQNRFNIFGDTLILDILLMSIVLQHYRIHMDIGNSKNYLGMKYVINQIYSKSK